MRGNNTTPPIQLGLVQHLKKGWGRGLSHLASCSKISSQAYNATEIETLTATRALSFAHKLGFRWATLEGDSLVVINALKTEVPSLAPLGLLIEDVKMLSLHFDHLLYSHYRHTRVSCTDGRCPIKPSFCFTVWLSWFKLIKFSSFSLKKKKRKKKR